MTNEYGFFVLTSAQTRAMDASVESEYGLPLAVLMENAGRAVADRAMTHQPGRVLVAVGPGNNGGDAMVAARLLHTRGIDVMVVLSKSMDQLRNLSLLAARRFVDVGGNVRSFDGMDLDDWRSADLIIDGLLGTGVTDPVRDPLDNMIWLINMSGVPVLSIDVPSGIASDRSSLPETAVRATETVTLGCWKPALVHYPAAEWAGQVILADIGFPAPVYPEPRAIVLQNSYVRCAILVTTGETHKGKRGTLAVIAGSQGMMGAAVLACQSAMRAGAGLVYLCCPESLAYVYASKLTEPILRPAPDGGKPYFTLDALDSVMRTVEISDAVVLGPGLGQDPETVDFLKALLPRIQKPLVFDADALNIAASHRLRPPAHTVMTPHPGEMARLLDQTVPEVQEDRFATVENAVKQFGCAVILKGAHSVIAAPDEPLVVNTRSHSSLATAGSGDLLSGILGALLSQSYSPFEAAVLGVRWHGTCGVLAASDIGETVGATQLLDYVSKARKEMLERDETEFLV